MGQYGRPNLALAGLLVIWERLLHAPTTTTPITPDAIVQPLGWHIADDSREQKMDSSTTLKIEEASFAAMLLLAALVWLYTNSDHLDIKVDILARHEIVTSYILTSLSLSAITQLLILSTCWNLQPCSIAWIQSNMLKWLRYSFFKAHNRFVV